MTTSRIFIFVLIVVAAAFAEAGTVTQVKGSKALLDLTGMDDAKAGDEFFSVTADGKKKAILKIAQVKKGKAVAEIVKGKPEVGQELQLKAGMTREVRDADVGGASSEYAKRLRKKFSGASWGLLGEMLQTSMDATFNAGAGSSKRSVTASMKGTTFGLLGFYDYPVIQNLQIRGLGGLEMVTAKGSIANPDCDGGSTADCSFNVTYLSIYGAAKYTFIDSAKWRMWGGGGYGFLLAMSKASNVISTSQITTNQIYSFSVGADIVTGRSTYIPVTLEYGMFPASDTVKANILYIRAGYAWNL